jgi:hypothetical protein
LVPARTTHVLASPKCTCCGRQEDHVVTTRPVSERRRQNIGRRSFAKPRRRLLKQEMAVIKTSGGGHICCLSRSPRCTCCGMQKDHVATTHTSCNV